MSGPLTPEHRHEIAEALRGPAGSALIKLMHDLATTGSVSGQPTSAIVSAQKLGWIDEHRRCTPLGYQAADPLREFVQWQARNRVVAYGEHVPFLGPELFAGKRVLEIGSGFGVNLLTLDGMARSAVGFDIDSYRLAFTAPLAERAGRPRPIVVVADGAAIPAHDGSADVVIVLGALQYMPIQRVFTEAARLLVPGGYFVFVNSDLSGHLEASLRHLPRAIRHPKALARDLFTLGRMLLYPKIGPSAVRVGDPVYLPATVTRRWLDQAGFQIDESRTRRFGVETCWVSVRRF